ncbi:MAG: hypothetical protein AB1442_10940 [Nitrospirota bacterium]
MKRAVVTMFILAFIVNLGSAEIYGGTQGTETKQKGHLQEMKEEKERMTPEKLNESMKEMMVQMSEMMQKMSGMMTDASSKAKGEAEFKVIYTGKQILQKKGG